MQASPLSIFIRLLLFSILTFQVISSASFPNPPAVPSASASPEEWSIFWKLLNNYYAIITRPRFGKRYDSMVDSLSQPSLATFLDSDSAASSDNEINFMLGEHHPTANDHPISINELYRFSPPHRRQRRR